MFRKILIVFILLFSCLFVAPSFLGNANVDAAKAKKCPAQRPSTPPIITSAVSGDQSITLNWIETPDPVSNYVLQYSTSPYGMEYGNPNIGGKGTTSYTVGGLQNGVKYYFKIRGVYECQPGKLSNRITATPGGFVAESSQTGSSQGSTNLSLYKPVLGASTSAQVASRGAQPPSVAPAKSNCIACQGGWILGAEALLLFSYFYLSNKNPLFKKSASAIIPIGAYILFLFLNNSCAKNSFWCKYFVPLDVIIYVLFVINSKYGHIFKKLGFLKRKAS